MPKGRGRTAAQAIAFGFKYADTGIPYKWGGNSLTKTGGIDCSHFVCKCYDMGYETTATMVSKNSALGSRDFTRMSYSKGAKPGDILVYNGHTGMKAKRPSDGILGTLESYGSHGPGFLKGAGSGGWTTIWRPKEGMGIYPVKWKKS